MGTRRESGTSNADLSVLTSYISIQATTASSHIHILTNKSLFLSTELLLASLNEHSGVVTKR